MSSFFLSLRKIQLIYFLAGLLSFWSFTLSATSIKYLSTEQFDTCTDNLRSTLEGNFVTVWRGEWKVKLSFEESNEYIKQMVERFFTEQTRNEVMRELDPGSENYIEQISQRIEKLQKDHLMLQDDKLKIRDSAPKKHVTDSTFTYYTKPLCDESGVGKHQVRLRTYLRNIYLNNMHEGASVSGYSREGEEISITKLENGDFFIRIVSSDGLTVNEVKMGNDEMIEFFGDQLTLFAQPGGNFKFEIKSALKDEITSEIYQMLRGKHLVQKIDISIKFDQIEKLFRPLTRDKGTARKQKAEERVNELESEIIAENPENSSRIKAIFEVVRQGIDQSADFLKLEGATHYRRIAFEGNAGFQTTIDSEQCVFLHDIYTASGELKDPVSTSRTSKRYLPKDASERHVEIKFPVSAVVKNIGVNFYQEEDQITRLDDSEKDEDFQDAAFIYHQYKKDCSNPGKFYYLIEQNGTAQ